MSKHTPGPWKHDGYERVRPLEGKQDGTNDICHVYQHHRESMENTRLIAAAPDLMAACEAVERELRSRADNVWFPIHVRLAVQAAIAKADGSQ